MCEETKQAMPGKPLIALSSDVDEGRQNHCIPNNFIRDTYHITNYNNNIVGCHGCLINQGFMLLYVRQIFIAIPLSADR